MSLDDSTNSHRLWVDLLIHENEQELRPITQGGANRQNTQGKDERCRGKQSVKDGVNYRFGRKLISC